MYMTTSFAFFIFAGGMAMLMRAELAPGLFGVRTPRKPLTSVATKPGQAALRNVFGGA
jgi:hypothetical protein